jgi:hypothetical protein
VDVIDEAKAREIASHWHSPSPHDDQINRLSHGLTVTDWERLHDQVMRCLGEIDPVPMEKPHPALEVHELLDWIEDAYPALWRPRV